MEKENLNEASMQRFYQHLTKDGDCIAIVSAERGYRTKAENNAKTKALRDMIISYQHFELGKKNYGFHKAKGGYSYREPESDKGERAVCGEETSFCIYAHCENDHEELKFRKFVEFLGQKFEQESVLFVDREKQVMWIYTTGVNKGRIELKGKWHPNAIEEYNKKSKQIEIYYTKIKGKELGFENLKSPDDVEVEVKPMTCEAEEKVGFLKLGFKPSEIMHIKRMFEVFDEQVERGDVDFTEANSYSYSFEYPAANANLKEAIKQVLLK